MRCKAPLVLTLLALLGPTLALASDAAKPAPVPVHAPDPIEGSWSGQAGFPTDRAEIGLSFERDAQGAIHGYLSQFAYYHQELPGVVMRETDGDYLLDDIGARFTVNGDHLEGTWSHLNMPMTLRRVPALAGEQPVPPLPAGPGPRWRTAISGAVYAPAAVRDGRVYVGTTGGLFTALDRADGHVIWMFAAGRAVHGQALVTADAVYFTCDNGFLFKLDTAGKEVWRADLGDARAPRMLEHAVPDFTGGEYDWDRTGPRPVLVDGTLYVGSGDGAMHAIDAASGKEAWSFSGGGKVRNDAWVEGDRLFFGGWDGTFFALDRRTGTELWRRDVRSQVTSSPVVLDGQLLVGTRGGVLVALDPATGKTVWRNGFWGSSVESTPASADGKSFYIGSSDLRRVAWIDAADGRVHWRTDAYGAPWARPAVGKRLVYASIAGLAPYDIRMLGSLVALERESGKIAWRWESKEPAGSWVTGFVAPPVIDGDLVLVGGLDGAMYAFPAE